MTTRLTLDRRRVDEIMDSPDLPRHEHDSALASLKTINRLSLTARSFLPHVCTLSDDLLRRRLTLLDVACGGGDVPVELARLAAARGIKLDLTLADKSPTALEHAADAPANRIRADALSDSLPHADVVTCSLFLHHLDRPDVVRLLAHLASRARQLLLISDLRRSRIGYAVAWSTCRIASRSHIVHHDGPASVRAAYTPAELTHMAHEAGLTNAFISRTWPWRMLLRYRRTT